MGQPLDISFRFLAKVTAFILLAYILFIVRDIIFLLYVCFLLALSLNPLINRLEKSHLPRPLGIVLAYIVIWAIFGLLIALITPPLVSQTRYLISILPQSLARIDLFSTYQTEINREIFSRLSLLPQAILSFVVGLFSNLVTVFTALVITFYLLNHRQNLPQLIGLLPLPKFNKPLINILTHIENRLGHWLFGELTLMFSVGLLTYVGLKILGVEATLPLALIAGVLELIPNIGPTISAVPAILVALSVHPFLALSTAALYFIVQFVENNFLVPKIMQKAVGISPILSITGLMIGFRLAGPVGAILAIPTIIVIETIYIELKK